MVTHEYAFSVNEFGDPVVYTDAQAICMNLTHLLLLEPGTFQSHPDMGVGLISKYRYTIEDRIDELRDDFRTQIEKYLPQYQAINLKVVLQNKIVLISIQINESVYGFFYDTNKNEVRTTFKKLEDL